MTEYVIIPSNGYIGKKAMRKSVKGAITIAMRMLNASFLATDYVSIRTGKKEVGRVAYTTDGHKFKYFPA